ncbi:MAG: DUF4193 domain-containing protein [Mycobacterium sp.]|nr:DUF4193 domain-containing protein [Mycobacterium sp.]
MTIDYDTPRRARIEAQDEPLDELTRRRNETSVAAVDVDDDAAESFDLPDADRTGEVLMVRVIPKQADEFTCRSCFLVQHRNRLASGSPGKEICTDCA